MVGTATLWSACSYSGSYILLNICIVESWMVGTATLWSAWLLSYSWTSSTGTTISYDRRKSPDLNNPKGLSRNCFEIPQHNRKYLSFFSGIFTRNVYRKCWPFLWVFFLRNVYKKLATFLSIFPQECLHKVLSRAENLLIRSFCSNQLSDCERLAQIAQDKWATVSDSLRSLRGNEQMSDLLQKF